MLTHVLGDGNIGRAQRRLIVIIDLAVQRVVALFLGSCLLKKWRLLCEILRRCSWFDIHVILEAWGINGSTGNDSGCVSRQLLFLGLGLIWFLAFALQGILILLSNLFLQARVFPLFDIRLHRTLWPSWNRGICLLFVFDIIFKGRQLVFYLLLRKLLHLAQIVDVISIIFIHLAVLFVFPWTFALNIFFAVFESCIFTNLSAGIDFWTLNDLLLHNHLFWHGQLFLGPVDGLHLFNVLARPLFSPLLILNLLSEIDCARIPSLTIRFMHFINRQWLRRYVVFLEIFVGEDHLWFYFVCLFTALHVVV